MAVRIGVALKMALLSRSADRNQRTSVRVCRIAGPRRRGCLSWRVSEAVWQPRLAGQQPVAAEAGQPVQRAAAEAG